MERPWEHMFKRVIHEMFHNRNGAAVNHLFLIFFASVHRFALACL